MIKNGNRAFFHHVRKLLLHEPLYLVRQIGPYLMRETEKRLVPFTGGRSSSLKFAWIMLTYRCNLRCEMCGLWGFEGIWKGYSQRKLGEELGLFELRRFLDEVAPFRPMVLLTGGEPMLYPQWHQVARHAKQQGLRVAMSTNATLLRENAQAAAEVIDVLEVSLDGIHHIHDQVRKREHTFERVISGIQAVALEKEKKGSPTPYLNLSFTINNINFQSILDFVEYLEAQPFPFHRLTIRHLEYITQEKLNAHLKVLREEFARHDSVFRGYLYPVDQELKRKVCEQLQKIMQTKMHGKGRIVFEPPLTLEEAERYYEDPDYLPQRFRRCFSPWLGASLLPNGELWICPDFPIGNIKDASFLELWNNEKAKMFRHRLNKQGLMPACRTCASLYIY